MSTPRDSAPEHPGVESGVFSHARSTHASHGTEAVTHQRIDLPKGANSDSNTETNTETNTAAPPEMAHSRVQDTVAVAKAKFWWAQKLWPWRAFSHFTNVGGAVLAAGMSYQALFAVFASLWVCFGVLGIWLSGRPELLQELIDQINVLVPGLLGDHGVVSVTELLASRSIDWTSAIAGVALVWVTLNWFTGTRRAIRIIFGLEVKQYRNAALLKLRDLSLALVFLVALLISAALTVLSSHFTDWLFSLLGWDSQNWLLSTTGVVLRYALLYAFDVALLVSIVYFLAEVHVKKMAILTGCGLGGLVLWGLKLLGTEALGGASSNPLLASFAVFVGLMLWFNLICRTLLLTAAWIATGIDRSLGAPLDAEAQALAAAQPAV